MLVIRNTYLMKKGDVFAYFIRQSKATLDHVAQQGQQQISLQQKLMSCLKKYSLIQDEEEMDRLTVSLDGASASGWDRISLQYK